MVCAGILSAAVSADRGLFFYFLRVAVVAVSVRRVSGILSMDLGMGLLLSWCSLFLQDIFSCCFLRDVSDL